MDKRLTLIEFLEATGAEVQIYDVGRRITKISRNDFIKFENLQLAYPYPMQQQAWFGLCMLDESVSEEPIIWFLHLSLDETGKLLPAGRDYFIQRLFEAASVANQDIDKKEASADALKDNPHIFKPREDKMAAFHARIATTLKQAPSRFYKHAQEYFSGEQGWEQWNFVGFQGIADIVERLKIDDNKTLVATAIPHLPIQPLEALCQCLENVVTPLNIANALLKRCQKELSNEHPASSVVASCLRGISLTESKNTKNQLITLVLNSSLATNTEVLGAITARAWEWLLKQEHAEHYLNQLAKADSDTFNACLSDLLYMPNVRESLLSIIRSPNRPNQLAKAFGEMMKSYS